jgi:hypothetical protein
MTRPERSPTRVFGPASLSTVLPPRNIIGPSMRCRPPTREQATRRASQPPLRWEANASRVTGIILSPEVVPEVLTQSPQCPGHVTLRAPATARDHSGLKSAYSRMGTRSWYCATVRIDRKPCSRPNSVSAADQRSDRRATSCTSPGRAPHRFELMATVARVPVQRRATSRGITGHLLRGPLHACCGCPRATRPPRR